MSNLPKWFRIHLSTAIVLMIAAAFILKLNLVTGEDYLEQTNYGWPVTYLYLDHWTVRDKRVVHWNWDFKGVFVDTVGCSGIIASIAIILEKRIAILARMRNEKRE